MHNCREIREEILDLAFDESGEEARLRLLAEFETCSACRALYQTMTETQRVFDRFDQATEASLPGAEPWPGYARFRAELIEEPEPNRWHRVISFFTSLKFTPVAPRWPLTAAVSLLLLALALGWWLSLRRNNSAPMDRPVVIKTPEPEKKPESEEKAPPVIPPPEKKSARQKSYLVKVTEPSHTRPSTWPADRSQEQAGTQVLAMTPLPAPIAGLPADLQMARHFEKAEILLRAFRNAQPSEDSAAIEVADERRRSRRLISQNIVLRREAETESNVAVKELLSNLEPLLLDIANLPDQASSAEVRSIQERIERREIVAVLQVYSALTTPSDLPSK